MAVDSTFSSNKVLSIWVVSCVMKVVGSLFIALTISVNPSVSPGILLVFAIDSVVSLIKVVSNFLLKSVVINSASVDILLSKNSVLDVLSRFIKVDSFIIVVTIVVG